MVLTLQPCDWIEHDEKGKYVVDVYGRTEEGPGMVRIEGFKPYFWVLPGSNTIAQLKSKLTSEKINASKVVVTEHSKYDAFEGFNHFKPVKVWKIEFDSMRDWRGGAKVCKDMFSKMYESNIPPFLRLFHEREIGPASPIVFQPSSKLENGWCTQYRDVSADPSKVIPLKVAAYDIECTSRTGQFPIAVKDWNYVIGHFAEDLENDDDSTLTDILLKRLELEGFVAPSGWRERVLVPFLSRDAIQSYIEDNRWDKFESEFSKLMGTTQIGDPIIQVGVSIRLSTDMLTTVKRRVFVWGTVSGSPDFVSCDSEGDTLEAFEAFIKDENVDIVCGYNTYGFDDKYVHDRAEINGVKLNIGRSDIWGSLMDHKVFELASGKYNVNFLKMPGRLSIDLLLNMRREHNLDSYTLDNVASTFLRDKVVRVEGSTIHTKTTRGLFVGNYVKFDVVGNTINSYQEGKKFLVKSVSPKSFVIDSDGLFDDLSSDDRSHLEWSFTKDDIHPADIFRMHDGSAEDRGTIAKYCIQDCDLVLTLMAKLDTLVNARGMADVCFVPFQYLFLRGQGIKIFSRVAYEASKRNQIIVVQESFDGDTAYEGAIVISPKIGMYLETPVAVLDFNSLYPSSMIGENLSPDTLISMKTYNAEGKVLSCEGMASAKDIPYNEVSYDIKNGDTVVGKCVCLYVKPTEDNELSTGLIPRSLEIMLKKRKEARKKMEDPTVDDAQKSVYNGLQLAYKVVANSIYGQMGSRTSPIRKICVAACTTAVGRRQLLFAKSTVETEFGADVVYGDTDSIFVKFPKADLVEAIRLGQESAKMITSRCRHKAFVIGYEKTFYPFILFCRKRYVGMKYEEDPTKCYRASMGIVLKRRDNAPIVKDVFGGALDILLKEKNVKVAADYVKSMLIKVMKGDFPLEKFAITKQLRDDYVTNLPDDWVVSLKNAELRRKAEEDAATVRGDKKFPEKNKHYHNAVEYRKIPFNHMKSLADTYKLPLVQSSIAHRTLADRMTARDPGNAPNVGDRLKFVYIQAPDKKLQGDKIEHIDYVKEKKLPIDTVHYITNQIQNPVAQLFALCIDQLDGYVEPRPSYKTLYEQYLEKLGDSEEATLKVLAHKEKHLDKLMFMETPYLKNLVRSTTRGPLDAFFKRV